MNGYNAGLAQELQLEKAAEIDGMRVKHIALLYRLVDCKFKIILAVGFKQTHQLFICASDALPLYGISF